MSDADQLDTEEPAEVDESFPPAVPLWEDFVDIFFAPRQVFARRSEGRYGLVLFVLAVLSAILAYAVQSALAGAIEADLQRAIADAPGGSPQISPENLETMRSFGSIVSSISALVFVPIGVFFTGAVIWGMSSLFGASVLFKPGVMIATYATFPQLLQAISMVVQGMILEPGSMSEVSLGVSRFMDPESSPVLLQFGNRLEVFEIWSALLVALGVQVVGKVSLGKAAAVAAVVWLVGSLPLVLPALLRP